MAETNTAVLAEISNGMADAVERVAGSVVSIDDGTRLTATGAIWQADGVIVATSHGVESDENVSVITSDGIRHAAIVVGRDTDTDIVVLRIDAESLAAIPRSDVAADPPRIGTLAVAVGSPGDAGLVGTLGIVSARRDTETNGEPEYILYTDAVLYPGFSGGALVDATTGAFLGLLNRMYGRGLGVALGTPLVERVVATLLAHGKVPRGYLGVRTQVVAIPDSLRIALSIDQESGLLIAKVEPSSSADLAGLFLGDTLLAIDLDPVEDVDDLRRHLHAGANVNIRILRGGTIVDVSATIGADKN